MGRIITIICIIVLIVGGVWWWRNYHNAGIYDGSVVRREAAMETGPTPMENGQNLGEAHPTPSRSDAAGTINGDPVNPSAGELGIQTTPITQDPFASNGYSGPEGSYPPTDQNAPEPQRGRWPSPGRNQPPVVYPSYGQATDSQPPDAPDGVRFGGSGRFQIYRQGNLTFRVNTQTGSSCVLYATMEEWRRPDVYRHSCRAY